MSAVIALLPEAEALLAIAGRLDDAEVLGAARALRDVAAEHDELGRSFDARAAALGRLLEERAAALGGGSRC